MGDWIGLGVFVLLLLGAFFGLARLGAPRPEVSAEEFERRVQEARGTTGAAASLYSLQKLMTPKAAEAVEVMQDLKASYYDERQAKGDDDAGGEGDPHAPDAGRPGGRGGPGG